MKWLKQLFCWHKYEKDGFIEEYENGIRYSIRRYKCSKCGKVILVDGRYDTMKG